MCVYVQVHMVLYCASKFVSAIGLVCDNICQLARKCCIMRLCICFCLSFVLIIRGRGGQILGAIAKCDWFRCGSHDFAFVGLEVVYTMS